MAIKADSTFALAYAGLADINYSLAKYCKNMFFDTLRSFFQSSLGGLLHFLLDCYITGGACFWWHAPGLRVSRFLQRWVSYIWEGFLH